MMRGARAKVFALLALTAPLLAHNPDTSYLRCQVQKHGLELRFTFDPATLHRIVRPDADGDGKITRAEMEAVSADIFAYLEAAVRLEINGKPATPGDRAGLVWPVEAGEAIVEKDYHTQLLHFAFQRQSQPLIEDVYLRFELFDELGDRHRVIADIAQDEKHLEVIFYQNEPDYLYDTFWREDASARRRLAFRDGADVVWRNLLLLFTLIAILLLTVRFGAVAVTAVCVIAGVSGAMAAGFSAKSDWDVWRMTGGGVAALLAVMMSLPVRLLVALGQFEFPLGKKPKTREGGESRDGLSLLQ